MYLKEWYDDNSITYICEKCNHINPTSCNDQQMFSVLSESICILKDGEQLECRKCGNVHTSDTPLFKNTQNNISTAPKCPVCNSANIDKISLANKSGSVAMFGIFSVGHVSKTFKCKSCGYKF